MVDLSDQCRKRLSPKLLKSCLLGRTCYLARLDYQVWWRIKGLHLLWKRERLKDVFALISSMSKSWTIKEFPLVTTVFQIATQCLVGGVHCFSSKKYWFLQPTSILQVVPKKWHFPLYSVVFQVCHKHQHVDKDYIPRQSSSVYTAHVQPLQS